MSARNSGLPSVNVAGNLLEIHPLTLYDDLNKITGHLQTRTVVSNALNKAVTDLNQHITALVTKIYSNSAFINRSDLDLLKNEVKRLQKVTTTIEAKCWKEIPGWKRFFLAIPHSLGFYRAGPKIEPSEQLKQALIRQEVIINNEKRMLTLGSGSLVVRGSTSIFAQRMQQAGVNAVGSCVIVPTDHAGQYTLISARNTDANQAQITATKLELALDENENSLKAHIRTIVGGVDPTSFLKNETLHQIIQMWCGPETPTTVAQAKELLKTGIAGEASSRFLFVPDATRKSFHLVVEGVEEPIQVEVTDHGEITLPAQGATFTSLEDFKNSYFISPNKQLGSFALPAIQAMAQEKRVAEARIREQKRQILNQVRAGVYYDQIDFAKQKNNLNGLLASVSSNPVAKKSWYAVTLTPANATDDNWETLTIIKFTPSSGLFSFVLGGSWNQNSVTLSSNNLNTFNKANYNDCAPLRHVVDISQNIQQEVREISNRVRNDAAKLGCIRNTEDLARNFLKEAIRVLGDGANNKCVVVMDATNKASLFYKEPGSSNIVQKQLLFTAEGKLEVDRIQYLNLEQLFTAKGLSSIATVVDEIGERARLLGRVRELLPPLTTTPVKALKEFYGVLQGEAIGSYAFTIAAKSKSGDEQVIVHYVASNGTVESTSVTIPKEQLKELLTKNQIDFEASLKQLSGLGSILKIAFSDCQTAYTKTQQARSNALLSKKEAVKKTIAALIIKGASLDLLRVSAIDTAKYLFREPFFGSDYSNPTGVIPDCVLCLCPAGCTDTKKIQHFNITVTNEGTIKVNKVRSLFTVGTYATLDEAVKAVCLMAECSNATRYHPLLAIGAPAVEVPVPLSKAMQDSPVAAALKGLIQAYESNQATADSLTPNEALQILKKAFSCSDSEITSLFRKVSLLVHPDKTENEHKDYFNKIHGFLQICHEKCVPLLPKKIAQAADIPQQEALIPQSTIVVTTTATLATEKPLPQSPKNPVSVVATSQAAFTPPSAAIASSVSAPSSAILPSSYKTTGNSVVQRAKGYARWRGRNPKVPISAAEAQLFLKSIWPDEGIDYGQELKRIPRRDTRGLAGKQREHLEELIRIASQ